ncbi:YopX family protein [Mammaliicoccus sciuri]|uniref:YopX family protein n=1 Tax=Mammaliicoccus sciuri TaxID=1296 RepID=UPI0037C925DA
MIPKFRAWDKVNKKMIEDVASIHFKSEMITTRNLCFYPFKDIELLQSTGLFDKNGKEIFEGDILKVEYGDLLGETRETLIIAKNPFEYSMEEAKFLDFSYIVEIIGNKFEHPHLLGED